MRERRLTSSDRVLLEFDRVLRTVFPGRRDSARPMPGRDVQEADMDATQQRHVSGLMRVNHAGEVAAQALYHGQSLTARDRRVAERMQASAAEENDHLAWCEQRLAELDGATSRLDPLWYLGSFAIGLAAGAAGDKWSLGFVAETERQVVRHIDDHLQQLPPTDTRSRAVLEQMREDEQRHGDAAMAVGGVDLPRPVRGLMRRVARVMTRTAYYI